ncbi:hypothetical protein AAC387_Pa05g3684 [Persea americana]|eukprot:TRINITY_DN27519_c0_g1_i2.p1 TRINITY_DN27519_c0_g1~~TRINITY_DN27519_c0_g1_i2.p1  ORF type:complete len:307 (+),score=21.17 TRINITY_DN27519_c0_g1_i2:714-1634(+)
MAFHCKFLLAVLLLLLAEGVDKARADGMVTGSVFCDQCKDGQMNLFDYPLNGAKVAIACAGSDGQMTVWKEETTNWLGNYAFRFEGNTDLSRCTAQVMMGSGQGSSSGCGAAAGPARVLNLFFRMFNMELYTVDSLLSQPARPMSFCPRSSGSPVPAPAPPRTVPSRPPPSTPSPPRTVPFFQASACPYQNWTMPQYKCYWKLVGPDTKVAVAFGLAAARKYGTDMNLWEGLQGKGDVYRTLLREGTAALLNSYNSIHFSYPTLSVVGHMNWALMGSPQQALLTAMQFKRANSGGGNVRCTFTPCK